MTSNKSVTVDLPDTFKECRDLINRSLMEAVHPDLANSLREPILYFLEMPGKKIRPLMTLFACEAVGGQQHQALPAATAIELFHDFTLIHDDIMDNDDMRRGYPTLHVKYGEDTAILVGDTLIGLAYTQLLKSPDQAIKELVTIFTEALVKVSDGQALDKEFETRTTVSLDEYLDMIGKKTAWLFRDACALGAICGGGDKEAVTALSHFGYSIGMGFQVQDDLLDFVADESKLGKKVGSDFLLDKKTYVVLKYKEKLATNPALAEKYPTQISDYGSLGEFQDALETLGIIGEVQALAERYITDAMASLAKVQPLVDDNPLYQLTRFLRSRQY